MIKKGFKMAIFNNTSQATYICLSVPPWLEPVWEETDTSVPSREEVATWKACSPCSLNKSGTVYRLGMKPNVLWKSPDTPMYIWEVNSYTYGQFKAVIPSLPEFTTSEEADYRLQYHFRHLAPREGVVKSFLFFPYEGEKISYKIFTST